MTKLRMNKRLRKKKHVGEFRELGFRVEITLRAALGPREHDAFADRFVAVIEAHALAFGGGVGREVSGFVSRLARGSVSTEARAHVLAFVAGDPDVERHAIGELVDAYA